MSNTKVTSRKRRRVYKRDWFHCRYCGRFVVSIHPVNWRTHPQAATIDHVWPKDKARENRIRRNDKHNMVTCCAQCNAMKADKDPTGAWQPIALDAHYIRIMAERS